MLALAIILSACSDGTRFNIVPTDTVTDGDPSLVFAGISSISNNTDTTATLNWSAHVDAVAYDIYNTLSGTPLYVTTIVGQATNQTTIAGLTPSAAYKFRIRMRNTIGRSDTNTNDLPVTMNAAPDVPGAIALQSPSYTPATMPTPTIRVGGVKNGDTVKLFTDSGCTTQVASGVATGSTIDLTTSALAVGGYTFYANATNSIPAASACSISSVAYSRFDCPANYVPVAHNTALGTLADFCVAKYEMKNVAGVATSQAAVTPWGSISQATAKTTCSDLNATNGVTNKYYLISNPEWMTIARDLEQVDANWSNGTKGNGVLARGHSDNSPASALTASVDSNPYSGTLNSSAEAANSGWEQKRTQTLSNGSVIWDLAGNVSEWVDWQVTPANKAYIIADGSPASGWREFSALNAAITGGDEMKPETWQPFYSTLGSNEGLGQYYAGSNASGGTALRGGWRTHGTSAGVYAMDLDYDDTHSFASYGFRCVYRP